MWIRSPTSLVFRCTFIRRNFLFFFILRVWNAPEIIFYMSLSLKEELDTWSAALEAFDRASFPESVELFTVSSSLRPWLALTHIAFNRSSEDRKFIENSN